MASPRLADPNFTGSVVLVLDDGPEGTLGVILNRPGSVPVGEILGGWEALAQAAPPAVMFHGGPVALNSVIGLAHLRGSGDAGSHAGWVGLFDGVGALDLASPPSAGEDHQLLDCARLFTGYAGWGPGQLDGELAEGAWFVLAAEETDVTTDSPEALWHDVLRRQGGDMAMLAAFPPHPSVN